MLVTLILLGNKKRVSHLWPNCQWARSSTGLQMRARWVSLFITLREFYHNTSRKWGSIIFVQIKGNRTFRKKRILIWQREICQRNFRNHVWVSTWEVVKAQSQLTILESQTLSSLFPESMSRNMRPMLFTSIMRRLKRQWLNGKRYVFATWRKLVLLGLFSSLILSDYIINSLTTLWIILFLADMTPA